MRKRQKFVLTALTLAAGLWGIHALPVPLEWRYWLIALLVGVAAVGSGWALREGLSGVEWLTVVLPPTLFTAGVGLFYILLPTHWLARLAVVGLFGIGQYALLLTANIFSVAAIRTIALFRAAGAVGFVMTMLTGFLLYDAILSFREAWWWSAPLIMIVSVLLLLPALWSVEVENKISLKVIKYTVWLAVLQGLMAVAISFWPVSLIVASLFLTTMLYIYLGISQHHFSQRLFTRTVWEYVTVGIVVLATMLLTAGFA
ncbi:MAG: hypothetical protein AAB887_02470 [Patescibacteria group bacterium]